MNLQDIYAIEGEAASEVEYYQSLQRAINSGSAWSFQGSYGRAMADAIDAGLCCLGKVAARDYYGNRIPARDQVLKDTPGSLEYVVTNHGQEWADLIANV